MKGHATPQAAIFSEGRAPGPLSRRGERFRRGKHRDRSRFYRIYIRYHDKSLGTKIERGPGGGGRVGALPGPPQAAAGGSEGREGPEGREGSEGPEGRAEPLSGAAVRGTGWWSGAWCRTAPSGSGPSGGGTKWGSAAEKGGSGPCHPHPRSALLTTKGLVEALATLNPPKGDPGGGMRGQCEGWVEVSTIFITPNSYRQPGRGWGTLQEQGAR